MAKLNWQKANKWQQFREAQRWNLEKEKTNERLISRLFNARRIVGEIQKSKKKFWQNPRIDLQERKKCNHEIYKKFFMKDAKINCRYCGQKIQ